MALAASILALDRVERRFIGSDRFEIFHSQIAFDAFAQIAAVKGDAAAERFRVFSHDELLFRGGGESIRETT